MELRKYKTEDCAEMSQLFYDTVHSVNAKDYTASQLDAWASGEVDIAGWNKSFLEHDTLIAEESGKIIGFCDMAEDGYIDRLYVHKDYQRIGTASKLVGALESRAAERGVKEFYTHASITAKLFFERQGYKAVKKNIVNRSDRELINYTMIKRI